MKTELFVLLIMAAFGSKEDENAENDTKSGEIIVDKNTENSVVVKIEDGEYVKKQKTSEYIGVTYSKNTSKWCSQRRSKHENKTVYYGTYENEDTAAHASDTVARKLMENGEHSHMLNFPNDNTEVHKKRFTSEYLGVMFNEKSSKWRAYRWSQNGKKNVYNGSFENEETAAHASDTLARKLMENEKVDMKVNFPSDKTEVHREKKKTSSKYFGVSYHEKPQSGVHKDGAKK